ncbi:MAG: ADP-ribosylglycohydrolase family protein [Rhodanobacter sp.]
MYTMPSLYVRRDRLAGGLWGLLIGNARGNHDAGPTEGSTHSPADVRRTSDVPHADPPATVDDWSLDGAQVLCLLMALRAPERFALEGLTTEVIDWAQLGIGLAAPRDVTEDPDARALVRDMEGRTKGPPPQHRTRAYERGTLLRMIPLVLYHAGKDADLLAKIVQLSSQRPELRLLTAASMLYALWARAELDVRADPWIHAVGQLRALGPAAGLAPSDLERVLALEYNPSAATAEDRVIRSLAASRDAIHATEGFVEAVATAIARGHDTDLTAAATGAIAGLRYGFYGIPEAWSVRLRGKEMIEHEVEVLLSHAAPHEVTSTVRARSSRTDPLRIGTLALAGGGRIGITFCPGKKQASAVTGAWNRDLDTDLAVIKAWGATHLVTLIAPWEFVDLDIIALPKRAKAHGLNWHHAPILDGRTPDDTPAGYTAGEWFVGRWPAIAPELHAALNRGEGVVVHCKGGLGRAGTVAGLLLAQREPGLSTEEIIQRVRTARPNAIETVVQERYLARVSEAPPPR